MAFNGSANFKPGEVFVVFRVGRRAARAARQRVDELRPDHLHARPADREARSRREGARRAVGLRRRPDARSRNRSKRNAASSSRSGGAASAPARGSAIARCRRCSINPGTPSACRSASPTSSAARRSRELRAFYDAWYRPDRMVVIAIGDIDPAQIEAAIRSTFGPLKARGAGAPGARHAGAAARETARSTSPPIPRSRSRRSS